MVQNPVLHGSMSLYYFELRCCILWFIKLKIVFSTNNIITNIFSFEFGVYNKCFSNNNNSTNDNKYYRIKKNEKQWMTF